jgi:hypothetical protein
MRHLTAFVLLSASVSFAQVWGGYVTGSSPRSVPGVWSGYVNGWQSTPQPAPVLLDTVPVRRPTRAQREAIALSQLAAQQAFFANQNYVQLQQVAAQQREQLARQEELAAEQRRIQEEQAAAAEEAILVQRQQLALQQQLLAQQQQQAAAEEIARVAEREAKLRQIEAEQKLMAEKEAQRMAQLRAEEDAKPREKGPDIHRWVDDDGVVHYSTKPRR